MKPADFIRYHRAIAFLEGLSNLPLEGDYMVDYKNPDVYLKKMRHFLGLVGNPDRGMKFVHITGTAGKGSVTNTVHEILTASGKKVGSFTSPFTTTSIEKIKVGNKYVAPGELADIVDVLKPHIDSAYVSGPYGRPSYFEIFVAIAFLYFKKQQCDVVVLEVGLGGRYDATNVIEKPLVTAITSIDYDHTEILGDTLEKIAYDKAGIIKKGSVFFTTESRPELQQIFADVCVEKQVSLYAVEGGKSTQETNQALAVAIAQRLGASDAACARGIQKSRLPCRFEIIQVAPLVVLDGAHNRAKIRSTVDSLARLQYTKLHVVVGMADNKNHLSMLELLIPKADSVTFTRFQTKDRKCAHPIVLLKKSKKYLKKGAKTNIFLDPHRALEWALKQAGKGDAVLVTGSFFLAGDVRTKWYSEDYVLRKRASW